MPAAAFVAPILPGKEEEWRRFIQEITEERSGEYEALRRRLGVHNESVWLTRAGAGETAIVYLEVEDPRRLLQTLSGSDEPFDVWLKEWLSRLHGEGLARTPRRVVTELIFVSPDGRDGAQGGWERGRRNEALGP